MKKTILFCLCLSMLMVFSSAIQDKNCDTKARKKEGVAELNPYYYSASKVNYITYDYKSTRKEIEVPLFKGEDYKMVFNKKGLPQDVLVEIFDKDNSHEGRKALFSTEGNNADIVSYSPKKSKTLYVNYTIPKSEESEKEGCLVFILGYQLSFVD